MNQGKPYSNYEMMYMAKFYESDGAQSIATLFGRDHKAISGKYYWMKRRNLLEHYRAIWNQRDVNALERR